MTANQSHPVQIRIKGQTIALKTTGDAEFVREVIDLVSQRIEVAEKRTKATAPHHIAVLALLDLAEEYVQAKRRTKTHIKSLEKQTGDLFSLIEAEIK